MMRTTIRRDHRATPRHRPTTQWEGRRWECCGAELGGGSKQEKERRGALTSRMYTANGPTRPRWVDSLLKSYFRQQQSRRRPTAMLCELTLAASPKMLSSIMLTAACCSSTTHRPALISQSTPKDPIYYFGCGSNMLRSKVEGRGADGRIKLQGFQPAVVHDHRLSFNLRGFAPLEPGIGSLDPCIGSEAHGALISMTADEYEKVWLSEGGGHADPAYEEIVVEARPYKAGPPVRAIALRAREHARLPHGHACPSERYMGMLIRGAKELGLEPSYIAALEGQQTQLVPPRLHSLGVHYLFFVSLLFQLHMHAVVRALSWLLWRVYVPSDHPARVRRAVGNAATAALLAPGAAVGAVVRASMYFLCISPPPMLAAYAKIRPGCPGGCS